MKNEVKKDPIVRIKWYRRLAKTVAYLALIVSAAYGFRTLFANLNDWMAYLASTILVLLIVYIIFED